MNKTIEQFSDTELKALKADIYESNMQNSQNLQVINAEIQKRANTPKEKTDDPSKEPKVSTD